MEATARPAATIMLLRDGPPGIEVFMVVRHHAIDFAAGALVFPGGRVEEADHDLADRPRDCPNPEGLTPRRWRSASPRSGKPSRNAACCWPAPWIGQDLIDAATLKRLEDQHRAALNAGSIGFDAVLGVEGLLPAPDLLVHFAHWITPAHQPKRYDTHFFLAEAPANASGGPRWSGGGGIDLDHTRAGAGGHRTGRFKLVFATAKNLEKLGRAGTVEEAMAAARAATVVTVQPKGTKLEGTRRLLRIPEEAGYGGSEFIVDFAPAS